MNKRTWIRWLDSFSDNLKSKIQNLKWVGLFAIVVALTVCGARVEAQQAGKIFRIGFLGSSTAAGSAVLLDVFRQELSKLGWTEGKNITIEYRFAEGKNDRLPELAADLVRLKVDLIVTSGGTSPFAAKKATSTIPIVMMGSVDPVGAGLIASLARPGGNITGFTGLAPELNTKRLEILKDAVSKLGRVGLLWSAGGGLSADLQMKDLRAAALALKLKLEEIETQRDPEGLECAFRTAKQKQVEAMMTTTSRQFLAERKRIVDLAVKYLGCLPFTHRKSMSMRAVSCPTERTSVTSIARRPTTSTKS